MHICYKRALGSDLVFIIISETMLLCSSKHVQHTTFEGYIRYNYSCSHCLDSLLAYMYLIVFALVDFCSVFRAFTKKVIDLMICELHLQLLIDFLTYRKTSNRNSRLVLETRRVINFFYTCIV